MSQANERAKALVNMYYQEVAAKIEVPSTLHEQVKFTFNNEQAWGNMSAAELRKSKLENVNYRFDTFEAHDLGGPIVIMLTGQILLPGESNPMIFAETLVCDQNNKLISVRKIPVSFEARDV